MREMIKKRHPNNGRGLAFWRLWAVDVWADVWLKLEFDFGRHLRKRSVALLLN
jgi:hypothetical protein